MKLGRKKPPPPPSSSSSRPSLISHVFPTSWLSKFKHMSISSKPNPGKVKRKGKQNSPSMVGSVQCAGENVGRFYGGDDDGAFWRLSFGEESANGEKIDRGVLKSVWYESDTELDFPSSRGCRSSCHKVGEGEEAKKFNKMVLGLKKVRELPKDVEISLEVETKTRTPRRRVDRDGKLRKMDRQIKVFSKFWCSNLNGQIKVSSKLTRTNYH